MKIERTNCDSVTETLIKATEHADRMKCVIVLYETKDEIEGSAGGIFIQPDVKLSKINWMLDQAKHWLFCGCSGRPE